MDEQVNLPFVFPHIYIPVEAMAEQKKFVVTLVC